jgi:uncharacterized damage-inducible protein DinB
MSDIIPPSFDTNKALIAALADAPRLVEDVLAKAPTEALVIPPAGAAADEWTVSEIVGHLCDASRLWGGRMRRVLFEDEPTLPLFDENESVALAAYRYTPVETLAREFRLISEGIVSQLQDLTPEQWERTGTHPERGRLTLKEIVSIEANHERLHVVQLEQTLNKAAQG